MGEGESLAAGALSATLVGADLRFVRWGDLEVVRRIYVAVRDADWNTIPAEYSPVDLQADPDRFTVRFAARHRYRGLDYQWLGTIAGSADGVLSYEMDGVASGFPYNRIGLNIHHPLAISAGRQVRANGPSGSYEGVMPDLVGQQRIEAGIIHALFPPFDALDFDLDDGRSLRFAFEGEVFETEDQRNWTDANFKTYGQSLLQGLPREARPGERLRQKVTLRIDGPAMPRQREEQVTIELAPAGDARLPRIGLGLASDAAGLTEREASRLRALRLDHLRVDVHIAAPGAEAEFNAGLQAARRLGTALELALFVDRDSVDRLSWLAQALGEAPVARVLVFDGTGVVTTPAVLVERVRDRLSAAAPRALFAGGTNQFFAELNRVRPEVERMQAASFSLSPQVHACDDSALVENLEGQSEVLRAARAFADSKPIVVSPITLIARGGPFPAGPPEPGGLPPQVDLRQASLLGAGWTAASLARMAGAADSVTYYETVGWRGVIESDSGSPLPERFPSRPGTVFPLYHVFADVAEWKGAATREGRSSDPLAVQVLAAQHDATTSVLAVNLSQSRRRIRLGPLDRGDVRTRRLNAGTLAEATTDPERFRGRHERARVEGRVLTADLEPFEVLRIDA
jgi:hypothetical protein